MKSARALLERLRALPEFQKIVIVWTATILAGMVLLAWWIPRIAERIQAPQDASLEEQFQLQELQKQFENIPHIPTIQSDGEQPNDQ